MNNFIASLHDYATDILSLKIPAGHLVQLAAQRYIEDRERNTDSDWPYYFDEAKALKVIKFIQLQYHTKGNWGAKKLKIKLEPWQLFIIGNIFGWVHKTTHLRRFREADVIVARKNGKSVLASTIGLYMLVADGEYGSECYSTATTEKQAMETFKPALEMCRLNQQFVDYYSLKTNKTNIHSIKTASKFEPLIGKPGDGASPHLAIIDEYHEHATSIAYDTMKTGMGARLQPLIFVITTAGDNLAGPCYDLILDGRKVLERTVVNEEKFFIEYSIDSSDDWGSPDVLYKANPNMDISVFQSFLVAQQQEAVRNPRKTGVFRTKHLCEWIQSKEAYFNIRRWNECYDKDLTFDSEQLINTRCIMGLDLASKSDIAALVLLFDAGDGTYTTLQKFYLPENVATMTGNDHYEAWHLANKLELTPGDMIDHRHIKEDIDYFRKKYEIETIIFDPNQAAWMMGTLMDEGAPVIECPLNASFLSEPMRQTAGLIDSRKLFHNSKENDPMTWMLSNVTNKTNRKDQDFPDKERPELKIDGPFALIMCMSQCLFDSTTSIYETQEISYL